MRDGEAFRTTLRRGAKAVQADLVVHLSVAASPTDCSSVGFVVSKAVGNAVVRNRVKRQLRHSVAKELPHIGTGHKLVIRALSTASAKDSHQIHAEVSAGINAAKEKLHR